MARPLRIIYEGAVYHVTVRGNRRSNIFKSANDCERFISQLAESTRLYDVRLYLFCLMTNHVHLVFETPQANVSRFMQRLQTAYTVYFNRKYNQSGHLFQGRFGSSVVDEDAYILKLSRYVHLNPVYLKAHTNKPDRERVGILRNYPWSSYRSYIGKCARLEFVDYGPILAMMDGSGKKRNSAYRRFVEAGIRRIDAALIDSKRKSRFCIGSESCRKRIDDLYGGLVKGHARKEDVSFRREGRFYSTDDILDVALEVLNADRASLKKRSMNSMARPVVAYALCRYGGRTQRQAAEIIGLRSGVAVSLQIKKLHEQMESDKQLKAIMNEVKHRLDEHKSRNLVLKV
jgi:putative transposase